MEREVLDVDVLVVGAGPAGLACAIELARRAKARAQELSILVLDKADEIGKHQLSGAVLDPRGILELFPQARAEGFPVQAEVGDDALYWLTERSERKLSGALLPPPFKNHGNWIVSAAEVVQWLATRAEQAGVEVYAGFAGAELVYASNGAVAGVRTVDQGRDKHGVAKSNFQPGMEIRARLTVLAEGTRGSLTKQLIAKKDLQQGRNPQIWGVGVKEIWELPGAGMTGTVWHTAGWPLCDGEYGGGWIYGLPERRVSIGFVVGMDHGNPSFDYHARMQEWKTHPFLAGLLRGGKLLRYGAKTVPEGGLHSMPRTWGDGFLIVGDAAGFLNAARLKGLHLALKSGMLAAEAAIGALAGEGCSTEGLARYETLFAESWAHEELWKVRNFRQGFQKGFVTGSFWAGLGVVSGGRLPSGRMSLESDHHRYAQDGGENARAKPRVDNQLVFDKLTSVYHSGTVHEEDQPCHLVVLEPDICTSRCTREYGNPCQHFCPAAVYEWEEGKGLKINASNCVHCKTCDVADPYQIINWEVPAGGGPAYAGM